METFSDKIIVGIISSITSLIVSFFTIRINLSIDKRKNRREYLNKFISSNTKTLNELIKISNYNKTDYRELRECINANLHLYVLLPKKLMKKFFSLHSLITLQGEELCAKRDEIKKISSDIIKKFNKIGGDISGLNK